MRKILHCKLNKKKLWINRILVFLFFASIFVPISICGNCINHHYCDGYDDDCMMIYYEGELGTCVYKAMDDICIIIVCILFFVMVGSAYVWEKRKEALSPFVVMGIIVLIAFQVADIDPSKWMFAISMIFPFVVMILIFVINQNSKLNKNIPNLQN